MYHQYIQEIRDYCCLSDVENCGLLSGKNGQKKRKSKFKCTLDFDAPEKNCYRWKKLADYEAVFGDQSETDIQDTLFYKEYLSAFNIKDICYRIPEELSDEFDWGLLLRLIIGSFSSQYDLILSEEEGQAPIWELVIHATSGDIRASKRISELWSFQIVRLYEIYIEEMMNLALLKHEDMNECSVVDLERSRRLEKWEGVRDIADASIVVAQIMKDISTN